jgi:hypothetical protein
MEEQAKNPEQVETGISISDIAILCEVTKLAVERGAIKVNEMSTVGSSYDRVSSFLERIKQQAKSNQEVTGEV